MELSRQVYAVGETFYLFDTWAQEETDSALETERIVRGIGSPSFNWIDTKLSWIGAEEFGESKITQTTERISIKTLIKNQISNVVCVNLQKRRLCTMNKKIWSLHE